MVAGALRGACGSSSKLCQRTVTSSLCSKLLERRLEPAFAHVAPRARDVRPDIDVHQHSFGGRPRTMTIPLGLGDLRGRAAGRSQAHALPHAENPCLQTARRPQPGSAAAHPRPAGRALGAVAVVVDRHDHRRPRGSRRRSPSARAPSSRPAGSPAAGAGKLITAPLIGASTMSKGPWRRAIRHQ